MHMNESSQPNKSDQNVPVDFRKLACEHIARGFVVSATKPASKAGVWKWNGLNLFFTAQDVDAFLAENPDYIHGNVAVIGSVGFRYLRDADGKFLRDKKGNKIIAGRLLVVDVDADGVVEQILRETGHRVLPATYMVQSRPNAKPYKIHIYFWHTQASVEMFTRLAGRANKQKKEHSGIRDRSKPVDERGYHPNRYDVKGSGKGGYVLGAGSVHAPEDGGETYTPVNNNPVLPIPDWFVEWLFKDISKELDAQAEDKRKRRAHAKKVAALSPKIRANLRRENHPDGFFVSKVDTYGYMRAKANFLATKGGLPISLIKAFLLKQVPIVCHGGKDFIESEAGQNAIDHLLESVTVDDGESWLQHETFFEEPESDEVLPGVTIDSTSSMSQEAAFARIGEEFPQRIAPDDVYKAFGLSKAVPSETKLLQRVMTNRLRYVAKNVGGKWLWEKTV